MDKGTQPNSSQYSKLIRKGKSSNGNYRTLKPNLSTQSPYNKRRYIKGFKFNNKGVYDHMLSINNNKEVGIYSLVNV